MAEHSELTTGYLTGEIEAGWSMIPPYLESSRNLPNGGRLEVEYRADAGNTAAYSWRHIGVGHDGPEGGFHTSDWAHGAPTMQQACLDADHHANNCPL